MHEWDHLHTSIGEKYHTSRDYTRDVFAAIKISQFPAETQKCPLERQLRSRFSMKITTLTNYNWVKQRNDFKSVGDCYQGHFLPQLRICLRVKKFNYEKR